MEFLRGPKATPLKKNSNPFLTATPYGRRKDKKHTPPNMRLTNNKHSPEQKEESDHFINESSSDNISSTNEDLPQTGYESPKSTRGKRRGGSPAQNPQLLETPSVNKSKRIFMEEDGYGSPGENDMNYVVHSPRSRVYSESPEIGEPLARKPSGDGSYNRFFLNIPSDSRFMSDYTTLEILGRGSFGTVYRCRNNIDCLEYAVKKRHKKMNSAGRMKEALTEVYALAAVSITEENPYIVKYFSGWFEDSSLYIVMELCKTSLQKIAQSKRRKGVIITEEEVKRIMRDVTLGLKGLHSRYIVHLDIKPGRSMLISREHIGIVLREV